MVGIAKYGWNETWQAQRKSAPVNEWAGDVVRVITAHRGAYHVVGDAGTCWAELPGRSYHRAADRRELPVVGDWVIAERVAAACTGDGAARIIGVLPRTSFLVRRAAGRATEPQPIVANVDLGFIVTSLNTDLSLPRLDRYLAMLREGNIAPTVVLSKADLVQAPEIDAALQQLLASGVAALAVSAHTGAGMDELAQRVQPDQTAILLGSSGVGKSSIINAILGEARQSIKAIRDDERGKHTTTRRELVTTAHGLWIDSPGMRELARWHDDQADAFDDITVIAAKCKFADCLHGAEPSCAVRAAVAGGLLAADRLTNFHKLYSESTEQALRQRTAQQKQQHLQKLAANRTTRANRRR